MRFIKHIAAALLAAASLVAQPQSITLTAPPGPAISQISATVVGLNGPAQAYYWVIPIYTAGRAGLGTPVLVTGMANTLSVSNFVRISWAPMPGATGYDVLKTDAATVPVPCTCALAAATTAGSVDDTGAALSSYTLSSPVSPASAVIALNNRDVTPPALYVSINGGAQTPLLYGGGITGLTPYAVLAGAAGGGVAQISGLGSSGEVLTSNGAGALPTWQAAATSAPGGSDTELQYNNSGAFGGVASLLYNSGTRALTVPTGGSL